MKDAEEAVENLNGYDLEGRRIRVEKAKRNQPRDKTPGRYLGHYKSRNVVRRSNSYRYKHVFSYFFLNIKTFLVKFVRVFKINLTIFFQNFKFSSFFKFSKFQRKIQFFNSIFLATL